MPRTASNPVFVQEPDEVYYVIKGKSARITCKAGPVVQVVIKCAGQWIAPNRHTSTETIDPVTGIRYLENSIEVTKEEVEADDFGSPDGYFCECNAVNSQLGSNNQPVTVKSRKGQVIVASK